MGALGSPRLGDVPQSSDTPQSGEVPQSGGEESEDEGDQGQSGGEPNTNDLAQAFSGPELMNLDASAGSLGCSYASPGTGAYAQSLCWFDLAGFTTEYRDRGRRQNPRYASVLDPLTGPVTYTPNGAASAVVEGTRWGPIQNYPVSIDLGEGYRLTATISTSSDGDKAKALRAKGFPTWGTASSATGAFLGRNGFYTGVTGEPAIYQPVDAGHQTSTVSLNNIRLTRPDGVEVRNFSIVVVDAESTDAGESLSWSTTGAGFRWLPNTPNPDPPTSKNQVMGNACSVTASPAWNATAPDKNASCTSATSNKTGTAMLHTAPPANPSVAFNVTQNLLGGGKQGVAFGVITGRVEAKVQVVDRVLGADGHPTQDVFQITGSFAGSPLLSAATVGTDLEASAAEGLPIDPSGSQVAYDRSATGSTVGSYTEKWVCSKTVPNSATPQRWPTSGFSATPPAANATFTRVMAGEYLGCTVIYTPPYLQLQKAVSNAGSYAPTPLPALQNWNLTAAGAASSLPTFTGAGQSARTPVPVGAYQLSEAEAAGFLEAEGFTQVGWSCPSATLNGSQVSITKGADVTCTVENKSLPGSATWSKTAKDGPTGALLKGAEWTLTGPGVPANTTVTDCVTAGACGTSPFADVDPTPGKFKLEGLRWGSYTLKETKAPAGYQVSSTTHTFTVGKDGTNFALNADWGDVENVQQPVPMLPVSGGIGTDQIYMAMAAMLALAGGAYAVKRIRERQFTRKTGATSS